MNKHRQPKKIATQRVGGILPLVAVMLPVSLAIAVFAINIAYVELNRVEMQVAADAASRAATREFGLSSDPVKAMEAGKLAGRNNPVGGKPFVLMESDFVFGEATRADTTSRYTFLGGGSKPNAVEVNIRRVQGSPNGALRPLIPFGDMAIDVDATISSRANQTEADICLVIDRSGSMAYSSDEKAEYPPLPKNAMSNWWFGHAAPSPSRWRDLVESVGVFVDEVRKTPMNEKVGLVTYSDKAGADVSLVDDYTKISAALDKYTKAFSGGETDIADGITTAQRVLSGRDARYSSTKVMVLMTDGIDTTKSRVTEAAKDAADENILIFTVTFSKEADQKTMERVATIGLGKHYHAENASDLRNVFLEISRQIPVLINK